MDQEMKFLSQIKGPISVERSLRGKLVLRHVWINSWSGCKVEEEGQPRPAKAEEAIHSYIIITLLIFLSLLKEKESMTTGFVLFTPLSFLKGSNGPPRHRVRNHLLHILDRSYELAWLLPICHYSILCFFRWTGTLGFSYKCSL